MGSPTARLMPSTPQGRFTLAFLILTPLFLLLFIKFPPVAMDWQFTFYEVARSPLHPYDITGMNYLPWVALILAPIGLLPYPLSLAVNCTLNLLLLALLVIHRGGGRLSLFLALTSFPFLALLANGSVEWLPMIGFLLQGCWGIVFLLSKPQSGILVAINWFRSAPNKVYVLLPVVLVTLLSFAIWPAWPWQLLENLRGVDGIMGRANFSPWPWTIPPGLFFLYLAWKRSDDLFAVLATLCLVPYFTAHSMVIAFGLLVARSRKWGAVVWLLLWLWAILRNWGTFQGIIAGG